MTPYFISLKLSRSKDEDSFWVCVLSPVPLFLTPWALFWVCLQTNPPKLFLSETQSLLQKLGCDTNYPHLQTVLWFLRVLKVDPSVRFAALCWVTNAPRRLWRKAAGERSSGRGRLPQEGRHPQTPGTVRTTSRADTQRPQGQSGPPAGPASQTPGTARTSKAGTQRPQGQSGPAARLALPDPRDSQDHQQGQHPRPQGQPGSPAALDSTSPGHSDIKSGLFWVMVGVVFNAYIRDLEKWYWWTYLQGKNGHTDVESGLVDAAGGTEGHERRR